MMNKTFKRSLGVLAGLGLAAAAVYGIGVAYDLRRSYPVPARVADAGSPAQILRGQYVARSADCVACHTAHGGEQFAGGYTLATPFGAILASNITQDKETGIGQWDYAQFERAVRQGKGRHGYLYPAMPYTAYVRMSDADMLDLWAYMRTVAPVKNEVIENQLPFPFNQRWLLGGWNLLHFRASSPPATATPAASPGAAWLRGAYLVNGAGHCASCHTAKNALGGDTSAFLQGGMVGEWYAPSLTATGKVGIGGWSVDDIALYLKSGANQHAVSSGPMTEAVENSTQFMTDADLNAIGVYLKGIATAAPAPARASAVKASIMDTGKLVYESQCIACHVSDGKGVRRMIPSFADSAIVNAAWPDTLVRTVLLGSEGPRTASNPTGAGMPRFDWRLSDDDVAAVLTYMRNSWGNAAPAVGENTVREARHRLEAQAWIGAGQAKR